MVVIKVSAELCNIEAGGERKISNTEAAFIENFDNWFAVEFSTLILPFKTIALKQYLSPRLGFLAALCECLAHPALVTALTQALHPQRRKQVTKCGHRYLPVQLSHCDGGLLVSTCQHHRVPSLNIISGYFCESLSG